MANTGVWLIGALGGLATTVVVGARGLARNLTPRKGLTTEGVEFRNLGFAPIEELVFGGHEIRSGSLVDTAREICRQNGSIPRELIDAVEEDLRVVDARIRAGTAWNSGRAVEALADPDALDCRSLREEIQRLKGDLRRFRDEADCERVVVVNVASTEPAAPDPMRCGSRADLEEILDRDERNRVRASLLYAYAAVDLGFPYVNFTPNGALPPALQQLALERGAPIMGNDGKTGETLVKSALAPMFRDRNLRVLTWQGYNILGDRDGQVLSDRDHLESKVRSKDRALQSILGYDLHTHVGIDFVPSLGDMKTAWDFIHFEGFLGHRMAMQFIWQGCDAILAAPLILDLVRWMNLAASRGECGLMRHLAAYFKSPLGVEEHDFHRQHAELVRYAQAVRASDEPVVP